VEIEVPVVVTALISRETVENLDIKSGDAVEAVIKAKEVVIAKQRKTEYQNSDTVWRFFRGTES